MSGETDWITYVIVALIVAISGVAIQIASR